MEEEIKPCCYKFYRSQSNRLSVDCLKDSSGNLVATQAVARGGLTEPGNSPTIYNFGYVFSLASV